MVEAQSLREGEPENETNPHRVIEMLIRAMEEWAREWEDNGIPEEMWGAYAAGKGYLGEAVGDES